MRCEACGQENPESSKFCSKCGKELIVRGKKCPNPECGHVEPRMDAVFCPVCSTRFDSTEKKNNINSNKVSDTKPKTVGSSLNPLQRIGKVKKVFLTRDRILKIAASVFGLLIVAEVILTVIYKNGVSKSNRAYNRGDYEYAYLIGEKAFNISDMVIFKDNMSLIRQLNMCNFNIRIQNANKNLNSISINKTDIEGVKILYTDANNYLSTDSITQKIEFCDRILSMIEKESEKDWTSALDYCNEAIAFGNRINIPAALNSKLENEKNTIQEPKATIDKVWAEYDVTQDGEDGLYVCLKFETTSMKGRTGHVTVWFYDEKENPLKDDNESHCTNEGDIACGKDFTSGYDAGTFTEFRIFMPYSELHLGEGEVKVKFKVGIFYNDTQLDKSDYYSFTLTDDDSGEDDF